MLYNTLKQLKSHLIAVLSSRRTFYFLIFTWCIIIIFSSILLPPSDDSGYYFEKSMGFLYKHKLGLFVGDKFRVSFYHFPGFSIFQGMFLHITSFLQIPINIFTYRLSKIVLLLLTIPLTLYFIKLFSKDSDVDFRTRSNVFMILLAITPFSQLCWAVRPEGLGIFLILLAMLFYRKWDLSNTDYKSGYYLSALFLGLAAATHPNFSVVAGLLTVVIIVLSIRKKHFYRPLIFGVIAAIPLIMVALWFFRHYPESIEDLMASINAKRPAINKYGGGVIALINNSFFKAGYESLSINMVYTIFWLPLLIIIAGSVILSYKYIISRMRKDSFFILLFALFTSMIILLVVTPGTKSYFTIISYFSVLYFILLIPFKSPHLMNTSDINKLFSHVIIVGLIGVISLHPLIHLMKYSLFNEQYYFAPKTRNAVINKLKPGDTLMIAHAGRLVPAFIELFDAKYRGVNTIDIYQVAPAHFNYKTKERDFFLENKVQHLIPEKTIWGTVKDGIIFDKTRMKLMLPIFSRAEGGIYKHIEFNVKEIIFEDKGNLFFKPNNFKLLKN